MNWFNIKNQSDTAAEILLYGEIGAGGITSAEFISALQQIPAAKLTIRINSPGGSAFDGLAIFNYLSSRPTPPTIIVDGIAASIASVVAMAGKPLTMHAASQMMVHNASGLVMGRASEMRRLADVLDRLDDMLADIYAKRTGIETKAIKILMDKETWLSASEAKAAGFADSIIDAPATEPAAKFDLSQFANVPQPIWNRYAINAAQPQNRNTHMNTIAEQQADAVMKLAFEAIGLPAAELVANREVSTGYAFACDARWLVSGKSISELHAIIADTTNHELKREAARHKLRNFADEIYLDTTPGNVHLTAVKPPEPASHSAPAPAPKVGELLTAEQFDAVCRKEAGFSVNERTGAGFDNFKRTRAKGQAEAEWKDNPGLCRNFTSDQNYIYWRVAELTGAARAYNPATSKITTHLQPGRT